jgi:hypothetical protein
MRSEFQARQCRHWLVLHHTGVVKNFPKVGNNFIVPEPSQEWSANRRLRFTAIWSQGRITGNWPTDPAGLLPAAAGRCPPLPAAANS